MIAPQGQQGLELLEELSRTGDGKPPLGCMQCGLCAASCPLGDAMEFPPRKLILEAMARGLDRVLASPSLWMCVGCYTCSLRCPRDIELTDRLWPALRDRAMQQGFQPPAELQETFQNVLKYGNVLGKSPRQRLDWAKDLDVRVLDLSKEPRPVEVLWLVGCYPSYYPRNQVVTRAFARILTELGITWGVLGTKEKAVGECDRMFGEEPYFVSAVATTPGRYLRLDADDFWAICQAEPQYEHRIFTQALIIQSSRLRQITACLKQFLSKIIK